MWIQAQHPGVTGQYVQVPPGACHETWTQSDGTHMTLRSVHAEDAEELNAMVKRLSYESRRNRFHSAINALTPKTLERMVQVDFFHHCAYVVTAAKAGHECIVADGRYSVSDDEESAEFSIVVDDCVQRTGIGLRVMHVLLQTAQNAGLEALNGDVLCTNAAMIALARRCGFICTGMQGDAQLVRAHKTLICQDSSTARGHAVRGRDTQAPLPC